MAAGNAAATQREVGYGGPLTILGHEPAVSRGGRRGELRPGQL